MTNWSGGIQGGITNGEDVYFRYVPSFFSSAFCPFPSDYELTITTCLVVSLFCRVGFKPPATICQPQSTAKYDGTAGVLEAKGRHDPCVVPRAVPIVETMAAIALMDALLIQASRTAAASLLPPITTLPPTMVSSSRLNASVLPSWC